jgi:hypothetical protein
MERSGYPLSSMSALGASLRLLIQVLSFLRIDMLDCMYSNRWCPLYQTAFGDAPLRVFKPRLLLGEWALCINLLFCRLIL